MPRPIIVFDLDGTLIDTAPDLLSSLNHSLGAGGVAPVNVERFRQHAGMGGRVMIERAFAAANAPLARDEHERLVDIFLQHYGAGIPGQSQPYPGVLSALDRFEQAGFALAICTNKPERFSRHLMQSLGLDARFGAICGADTFPYRKPDPRHLFDTIAAAGGDRDRALMVGDSRTDIDTAKAAGIPVVAVDFGYTDRHVREFEPSVVISHFDELTPGLFARLSGAAIVASGRA